MILALSIGPLEFKVLYQAEGMPVKCRRTIILQSPIVTQGGVTFMLSQAIARKKGIHPEEKVIPQNFCQNGSGGNRRTPGVPSRNSRLGIFDPSNGKTIDKKEIRRNGQFA
jgi:hypothetical protein